MYMIDKAVYRSTAGIGTTLFASTPSACNRRYVWLSTGVFGAFSAPHLARQDSTSRFTTDGDATSAERYDGLHDTGSGRWGTMLTASRWH